MNHSVDWNFQKGNVVLENFNSIQIHINTNNSTSCNQANTAFTVPNYVSTINVQILVKSVAIIFQYEYLVVSLLWHM